jgi:transcriptional regulator with XRE-family HTH domain
MQETESFGSSLKRERELRKITLQEISQATRIRLRYLEAIEQEHFEKLPGLTFLKGYVRSYARYVGLDPGEALFRLEPLIRQMGSEGIKKPFFRTRWFKVILGLLSVAAGLILLGRGCLG